MIPTVSVLLPNFNHARFLPRALDAICNQTRLPTQVVIVDDASTDTSIEILQDYAKRYPFIELIRNKNNTGDPIAASKLGLSRIRGRYVLLAAADDFVYPDFISAVGDVLERHPNAGVCFTHVVNVDDDGLPWSMRVSSVQEPTFLHGPELLIELKNNPVFPCGVASVIRLDALRWAAKVVPTEDVGFLWDNIAYTACALKHGACFVPTVFGAFRTSSTSFSGSIARRPELWRKNIRAAVQFMKSSEVATLFPESYVRALVGTLERIVHQQAAWQLRLNHDQLHQALDLLDKPDSARHHILNVVLRKSYSLLFYLTRCYCKLIRVGH